MRATSRVLAAVTLAIAPLPPAQAQVQSSEKFTLTQVLDGVEIAIAGSRPSARGRTIYGGVVPYGHSWVAGARTPTTITVGRDFRIADTEVPAGTYTLWVMPREEAPWLLILDPRTDLNHWSDPDSTAGQFHAHLEVMPIDPVETLTWGIDDIRGSSARLHLDWGDRRASVRLRLPSTLTLTVPDSVAAPLVGRYADATPATDEPSMPRNMAVDRVGPYLRFAFLEPDGDEAGTEASDADAAMSVLFPMGDDLFGWGELYRGELVQVMHGLVFEITRDGGRVTGFEVRQVPSDKLWVRAVRTK